jgi:hypothetical protein
MTFAPKLSQARLTAAWVNSFAPWARTPEGRRARPATPGCAPGVAEDTRRH